MQGYNLTLDDVFADLQWLSHERKMAVAFAIYTNLSLFDVIRLKWSSQLDLSWRAEFILKSVPVSESIDNVFWERQDGGDVEMSSLPSLFDICTDWQDWLLFVGRYQLAVPIEFKF